MVGFISKYTIWDQIDNCRLIENNLLHIIFELNRKHISYFRIARESHQILYRSMIQALTLSNYQNILQDKKEKKTFTYQRGNKPWSVISKVIIKDCKYAYKFSKPQKTDSYYSDVVFSFNKMNKVISFFDLLARIQSECFLNNPIPEISDSNMKYLEWLHIFIRNEYEHFIPKKQSAPAAELMEVSEITILLSSDLLLNTGNAPMEDIMKRNIGKLLVKTKSLINEIRKQAL